VTEVTFSLSPQITLTLNGIALPPAAVPLTVRARITTGRDGVVKKVEQVHVGME
jgi:hypothetical protein